MRCGVRDKCLTFIPALSHTHTRTLLVSYHTRYMDEHGIDVHCLVPLPWLECEPGLHADEAKAIEVIH